MQIVVTEWRREWRGAEPQSIKPEVLALEHERVLFGLVVMLGNGEYDDVCFESDCIEAVEAVRGLLLGTARAGKFEQHPLAEASPLHRLGYEIYVQGSHSVFFLNPHPRPALFHQFDATEYMSEFWLPT